MKHQASKSIANRFDRKSFKVNSWTGTVLWMSTDVLFISIVKWIIMSISNTQAEEKQINTIIKHFKKNSHANLEQLNTKLEKICQNLRNTWTREIFHHIQVTLVPLRNATQRSRHLASADLFSTANMLSRADISLNWTWTF